MLSLSSGLSLLLLLFPDIVVVENMFFGQLMLAVGDTDVVGGCCCHYSRTESL